MSTLSFPQFFLLTPKLSGHCYGRFDQEPTGHQGLQRQPLRQNEQQEELNVPYPNACFPIPPLFFPSCTSTLFTLPANRRSLTVPPRSTGLPPNINFFVFSRPDSCKLQIEVARSAPPASFFVRMCFFLQTRSDLLYFPSPLWFARCCWLALQLLPSRS